MDKIINVATKFRWEIAEKPDNMLEATCTRLQLMVQAFSHDQLTKEMNIAMCNLFKKQWYDGHWNQYSFDHSIAFTIEDARSYVDVVPNPMRVK
jgi:hypothetical protein